MERYTRMLLHFTHSLYGGLENRIEAFLFATRLTRVTKHLGQRDIDRAVTEVAKSVPDWSGGTRIGHVLKTFNFDWARRTLGWGSVVLIVSDGWDRGDPEILGREMDRLQRSCSRLIWLNPLAGSDEYEPTTRGMQAAAPYIDDLLPVNNLASLEDLALHLNTLSSVRPERPQRTRPEPEVVPAEPAPAQRSWHRGWEPNVPPPHVGPGDRGAVEGGEASLGAADSPLVVDRLALAAAGGDHVAVDGYRLRRRQECDDVGHLTRVYDAAQWVGRPHPSLDLLLRDALHLCVPCDGPWARLGPRIPWMDDRNAYAVLPKALPPGSWSWPRWRRCASLR